MLHGLHNSQTAPAAQRWAYLVTANASGRADAAAVVLRQRLEALALQLAELEALRARVLEAEQKMEPIWANEKLARAAPSAA
jgi:hypothetical protein